MTITVNQLKRAIASVGREAGNNAEGLALAEIMHSDRVLTMLVNHLNNRGGVMVHMQQMGRASRPTITDPVVIIDEASFTPGPRTNAILGRNTGEAKRPIRIPLTPKTER